MTTTDTYYTVKRDSDGLYPLSSYLSRRPSWSPSLRMAVWYEEQGQAVRHAERVLTGARVVRVTITEEIAE